MRRIFTIILLLGAVISFSACSDDDDTTPAYVWGGDWNDPNDPNYKPEGYNPIQGLWKDNNDKSKGVYFSEDFKYYRVSFKSNGTYTKEYLSDYVINDKAYRILKTDTWRYKIEGNKLTEYRSSGEIYFTATKVQE